MRRAGRSHFGVLADKPLIGLPAAAAAGDGLVALLEACAVSMRSSRWLRLFTLAFVLTFALNASHAATVFKPSTCVSCPPGCPMHKDNRKCHQTPGKASHCHGRKAKAPGLYPAGCESRADGFTAADPPSLLVTPDSIAFVPSSGLMPVRRIGEVRAGFGEPLLHPPTVA